MKLIELLRVMDDGCFDVNLWHDYRASYTDLDEEEDCDEDEDWEEE